MQTAFTLPMQSIRPSRDLFGLPQRGHVGGCRWSLGGLAAYLVTTLLPHLEQHE
jgi:hypothetical protein